MPENRPRETPMLTPDVLPLELGELGTVVEANPVMPGVYDAALELPETRWLWKPISY